MGAFGWSRKDVARHLRSSAPVAEFGFLDFAAGDDIIEASYRHTVDLFEAEVTPNRFRPN